MKSDGFVRKFVVDDVSVRLDKFLVLKSEVFSRSKIQKLIKNGKVSINGEFVLQPHYFLSTKDIVEVDYQELEKSSSKPDGSFDLRVIYEDASILVVYKPSGVIVHQFAEQNEYSLVDELLKRYPEIKGVGDDPNRPGIVHRLDKHASGLLIVAKTSVAFIELKKQFSQREVEKEYFVLVHGKIDSVMGSINFRVGRSGSAKNRMAAFPANSEHGKEAFSEYELIGYYKNNSLLRVTIETGRTHQIRTHLYAIGYPVVGDTVYTHRQYTGVSNLKRLFLHAHSLKFKHPVSGEELFFEIPLPIELKSYLYELSGRHALILVSGPSGAGKTTLIKSFLEKHAEEFGLTTTYTTRQKRVTTSEDKIMHHVSPAEFEKLRIDGAFLESAEFNGNSYGTHRASILETLKTKDILVNIEVNGARQILEAMPEVYSIFIDVTDDMELRTRLIARGDVTPESIEERLALAHEHRKSICLYDFIVRNEHDGINEAISLFESIVLQITKYDDFPASI